MDFMKLLRSFEEFLFEAAAWLVLLPLTLWRILRRPLATMDYSDREQAEPEDRRYDDALSPPLVLLSVIVVANLVAVAAHVPPPPESTDFTRFVMASPQNLVLFRSLVFSLTPLVSAVVLIRRQSKRISRDTLRGPFYAQCYLMAPCAACISAGGVIFQQPSVPNVLGAAIMALGAGWFLTVQTRWFRRRLQVSWVRAAGLAGWAVACALVYLLAVLIAVAQM